MGKEKHSAQQTIDTIRRRTQRKHTAEDKIRVVLEGLKGEESIAELCRREGVSQSLYYNWSKQFLEAGKARLAGNTKREATSSEVKEMQQENDQLKQLVAELALNNRVLKKSLLGTDRGWED